MLFCCQKSCFEVMSRKSVAHTPSEMLRIPIWKNLSTSSLPKNQTVFPPDLLPNLVLVLAGSSRRRTAKGSPAFSSARTTLRWAAYRQHYQVSDLCFLDPPPLPKKGTTEEGLYFFLENVQKRYRRGLLHLTTLSYWQVRWLLVPTYILEIIVLSQIRTLYIYT